MVKDWRRWAVSGGIAVATLLAAATAAPGARAEDAQSYVTQAQALLAKGDLHGAEIELRNAVRENPNNASVHVELAQIYLKLGNLPAAEAEARLARTDHGDANAVDPVLAEALRRQYKVTDLFQLISPGNRPPQAEAKVRFELGLAHLSLHELDQAEPLLQDAERLDSQGWAPKVAMARLLLEKGDAGGAKAELAKARGLAPNEPEVMLLDAEILHVDGQADEARAELDKILTKDPNNLTALMFRGELLVDKNDIAAAQKDLDHALKLSPNNTGVIYLTALVSVRKGNLEKADDLLSKASIGFNLFPNGYYLLAAVEYALGENQQAEANISKFLAREPNQPLGHRLLAAIALRNHNPDRAIETLKPIVDAAPTDTASASLLAQAYLTAGRRDEALEIYQRAAVTQPDNVTLQTQLALMRLKAGETAEGLKDLSQIANTKTGADVAGPLLILNDLHDGKISEAAARAEALVKRDGNDIIAQNWLGMVRVTQKDYPAAEKIFKALLATNPNLVQVQRNLAEVYVQMNRPDDAKKVWDEILAKQPNDVASLMGLASSAIAQKDYGQAIKLLTQAQKASTKEPLPGLKLVQLYAAQKQWTSALNAGQNLEGQFPGNPDVIDLNARVRADSGDVDGAVQEYKRLLLNAPNSDAVWQKLAEFQLRAKSIDAARESLKKAITLAPNDLQHIQSLVELDFTTKGPDAALETARSFSKTQPIASALMVAHAYTLEKQPQAAITALEEAQARDPATPLVVRLAGIYYGLHDRQKAKGLLQAWIKDHDDAVAARLELADISVLEKDYDSAIGLYERAHQQEPDNVAVINNLAWLYAQKGDPRARDFAEQAFTKLPTAETADTLGWVLVGGGKADAGLPYLRQAADALPSDMEVQYHLAAALNATGGKDEARTLLQRVLKSDAGFKDKSEAERLFNQLQHG